jgi:prepilin-type N-terminal cleavage/methylation domain-containing protein
MMDKLSERSGFTLIEAIAVLVLIAIVSAVAISRGVMTNEADLQAEINTLKSHLRYSQQLAMNDITPTDATSALYSSRTKWGIKIDDGGTSYTLVKYVADAPVTHNLPLPNESSATHDFSPITATPVTILFDEWGSPSATSISFGGETITITANTGFIQ